MLGCKLPWNNCTGKSYIFAYFCLTKDQNTYKPIFEGVFKMAIFQRVCFMGLPFFCWSLHRILNRWHFHKQLKELTKGTFVPGTSSFFEELNGNEFLFKGTRNWTVILRDYSSFYRSFFWIFAPLLMFESGANFVAYLIFIWFHIYLSMACDSFAH